MSNVLVNELTKYALKRKRQQRLVIISICLILFVALSISWALKIIGFSLTGDEFYVNIAKTIDDLSDGNNPDTDLVGDDFYRLYLEAESTERDAGIDLLIVVDQSGTMFENADISYKGSNMYRDCVVSNILNGSAYIDGRYKPNEGYNRNESQLQVHGTVTESSLINQFLELDSRNKVAVIGFSGDRNNALGNGRYDAAYPAYARNGYSYQTDSVILLDWTGNKITSPVNTTAYCYTGTNYHSALLRANDMFNNSSIANDGNTKVMIFFSDGVPTCYLQSNGDRGGTTMSGTLSSPETQNILNCRQPSLDAFATFKSQHPDTVCYSVGISNELSSNPDDAFSDVVLSQYINVEGKGYYYSGNDGDQLHDDMMELAMRSAPSHFSITDQLSQYVQYYSDNADVKVTMTDANGTETLLYSDGITDAGKGIIKSVTYTPATGDDLATTTGTIKVVFEENYGLKDGYKYALSYNVVLTNTAYEKFITDGYGDVTGDTGTDHGNNNSSSGQGGLYSNKEAHIDYTLEGKNHSNEEPENVFDHPVVQPDLLDLTAQKVWQQSDGTADTSPHGSVTVQLYRRSTELGSDSGPTPTPDSSLIMPEGYQTADDFESGKSYILWNASTGKAVQKDEHPNDDRYHSFIYDYSPALTTDIPASYIWTYQSDDTLVNATGGDAYIVSWSGAPDNLQVWCGDSDAHTDTTVSYEYDSNSNTGKVKFTNNQMSFYLGHNYQGIENANDADSYVLIPVDIIPSTDPSGWVKVNSFTAGKDYIMWNSDTNYAIQKDEHPSDSRYHSFIYDTAPDLSGNVEASYIWTYQQNGTLINKTGDDAYIVSWSSAPDNLQVWCGNSNEHTDTTVSYEYNSSSNNGKIKFTNNKMSIYLGYDYHGAQKADDGSNYLLYEWHEGNTNTYRAKQDLAPTPTPTPDAGDGEPYGNPVTFSDSYTFEDLFKQGNIDGKIYKYDFYVKEVNVPDGYTVSYDTASDGTLLINNKKAAVTPPDTPTPTPDEPSPTPDEPTPTPDEPTPTPDEPTPTPDEPTPTPDEPTPTPDEPTPTPDEPTPTPDEPTPVPPTPTPTEEPDMLSFWVKKNWADDSGLIEPIEPVTVQIYQIATPTINQGFQNADSFEAGKSYIIWNTNTGMPISKDMSNGEYHSFVYDSTLDLSGDIPREYIWTYGSDGQLQNYDEPAYIPSWTTDYQTWCGGGGYVETAAYYSNGKIYFNNGQQTVYLTDNYKGSATAEGGSNYVLIPVESIPTTVPSGWNKVNSFTAGKNYIIWNSDTNHAIQKDEHPADSRYHSFLYDYAPDLSGNVQSSYIWTYQSNGTLINATGGDAYIVSWSGAPDNLQVWCGDSDVHTDTTVSYEYNNNSNNGKIKFTNNQMSFYLGYDYHGAQNANDGSNYILYEWQEGGTTYTYRPLTALGPGTPYEPVPYGDTFELSTTNECEYRVRNVPVNGKIDGINVTYTYYVVEVNSENKNYQITYDHDKDNPITDSGGTITITNKIPGIWGYQLPNTGGRGFKLYIWAGSVLTVAPLLFLLLTKKKRERRADSG